MARAPLDSLLNKLNAQQREAVLHGNGPLLLLAGAGSGKTSTMAHRIAHLIAARHMPAAAILGLSFTNKAAQELKSRVRGLVASVSGRGAAQGLTISTFHALCVRLLRAHAEHVGFRKDFVILDESDQKDSLREVLKYLKIDERRFDLDRIRFAHSQAKNNFITEEQAEEYFSTQRSLTDEYQLVAAASFGRYQEKLRLLNGMDFDDLLYQAVRLLEGSAEVRELYNLRFRHILVDEYQDTNAAQFRLLKALLERQQNLCVVGDDDQSIYAWRGADPTHILEFQRHFPTARKIVLDQNYRSTPTILDAANPVIAQNKLRYPKQLWSARERGEPLTEVIVEEDRAEAEFVASEIETLARPGGLSAAVQPVAHWERFAVLYRSNSQSRLFEEEFRKRRIPYRIVGGMSFLDRKEIKDVLSYWRLVLNPSDDASLRRILNWPARGVGKSTIEWLGDRALAQGCSLWDVITGSPKPEGSVVGAEGAIPSPRGLAKGLEGAASLRALLTELQAELDAVPGDPELLAAGVSQWALRSLARIGVQKALLNDADDPAQAQRRWESAEELANALGQMSAADVEAELSGEEPLTARVWLREYLSRLTLEAQDQEEDLDESGNQVTLLTLHGAKGLEYDIVFLVGCEEGFLPHHRVLSGLEDLSEERRLCYVGITRARNLLYLTRAKNRVRFGKPVPRTESRFLADIPKDLVIRRDESNKPVLDSPQAIEAHEKRVESFLSQLSQLRSQISWS